MRKGTVMTVLPEGAFGERVRTRLREEQLIWFTTVGSDGTPQPNPVWFLWDGDDTVLVYNRTDAHRLAHIDAHPQVALNLQANASGGDIVVLTGTARRATSTPPPHENPAYLAKYGRAIDSISGNAEAFAAEYSVPVEIDVRRIRGFG
jgi:PPOX class probable F420-dependent enzyme